tara:strand:- start:427 stop:1842 length:1416 start_codon:yes stop_codon:yes gene_type:complete
MKLLNGLKINLKHNILLIITSIFFVNFILNINSNGNQLISYYLSNRVAFFILILNSIFYYLLAMALKSSLNLHSLSLSLCYFLSSYFFVDFFLLIILKSQNFQFTFLIVSFLWIGLFFTKGVKHKWIYLLFPIYTIIYLLNKTFSTELFRNINYIELNTDVPVQWFEMAQRISLNNYFELFQNNVIDGHGLFLSYIQALIFKLNFFEFDFTFVRLNSNLFLIFSYFLIFDLFTSRKNKYLASLAFTSLILNSDWLTYLFIDSLMLEGIVSFFFCTFLVNLKNFLSDKLNVKSSMFFALFSLLIFSKQFISLLVILTLIYLFICRRDKNIILAFFIFLLDNLYKKFFTPSVDGFEYTQGLNFSKILSEVLTLQNLALENIVKIINQIFIDKPISLLLGIFLFINIFNMYKSKNIKIIDNIDFYIVIFNLFFIFTLFIVWWKDFGIQSSFRYALNTLHLIFVNIVMISDRLRE